MPMPLSASSSRRRASSVIRRIMWVIVQWRLVASLAATIRTASGRQPHSRTSSTAAAGSACIRSGPITWPSSSTLVASSRSSTSKCWAPGRLDSGLRLVMITAQLGQPGIRAMIWLTLDGVIENDQDSPAAQPAAVDGRPLGQLVRQRHGGQARASAARWPSGPWGLPAGHRRSGAGRIAGHRGKGGVRRVPRAAPGQSCPPRPCH